MTETTEPDAPVGLLNAVHLPTAEGVTPAGFQSRRTLFLRRVLMGILNGVTLALVLWGVASVFSADGVDALEIGILACVAISAPWTILGFWNSLIGLALSLGRRMPESAAMFDEISPSAAPLSSRSAVVMALRNEDPDRAFARLLAMRASLDATGQGRSFDMFVLSDTDEDDIAQREEALFARHRAALGGLGTAQYRRRETNEGYKAGNIWNFLQRWGQGYRFFVPLDADSTMSGDLIVRLTRIMEATPRLGILQSLACGAPSASAFGRLFQFGMRHGMRAFTLGSAWWQGDCGPFWGHNAVVRVAPFLAQCELPKLGGKPPLGGDILSHDQVEAVLMRRAGYEVRVLPVETDSFEDNPVTILDFMKREQRWCNGNMQYVRLLGMRDLPATSRFQLVQAMLMYLSAPAWMLLTALGAIKAVVAPMEVFDFRLAIGLFCLMVGMSLAPKIAGAIGVALEPGGVARYGGRRKFVTGVLVETVFSVLMSPAVALRLTIFLFGLLLGRTVGWTGQVRDIHALGWRKASRALWPQTLFGLGIAAMIWVNTPAALPWAAPILIGLIFAIPFAVLTASPAFGAWLARKQICATPEEFDPPAILTALESDPPQRALSA